MNEEKRANSNTTMVGLKSEKRNTGVKINEIKGRLGQIYVELSESI